MMAMADGSGVGGSWGGALDVWKVAETACDALSNVAYRNADNQAALLDLGVLPLCLHLLSKQSAASSSSAAALSAADPACSLHAGALTLLINLADTNRDAQNALGTPEAAAAVHRLLCETVRRTAGLQPILGSDAQPYIRTSRTAGRQPAAHAAAATAGCGCFSRTRPICGPCACPVAVHASVHLCPYAHAPMPIRIHARVRTHGRA